MELKLSSQPVLFCVLLYQISSQKWSFDNKESLDVSPESNEMSTKPWKSGDKYVPQSSCITQLRTLDQPHLITAV